MAKEQGTPKKIEVINQPDWREGFNSQATGYLGRDASGYYWAIRVSPQQDKEELNWRGPHAFREVAENDLIDGLRDWKKQDDKEHAPADKELTDKQRAALEKTVRTIAADLPDRGDVTKGRDHDDRER
jgi:hypothetical protein